MLKEKWEKKILDLEIGENYHIYYKNSQLNWHFSRGTFKEKDRTIYRNFYGELVDIEEENLIFEFDKKINYKSIISIIPVKKKIKSNIIEK